MGLIKRQAAPEGAITREIRTMVIGLILFSEPGYSETFFRNKIRFLTEAGIRVIVFANQASGLKNDYQSVEGFSKGDGKIVFFKKTALAVLRLFLSPGKAFALYRLNKQSRYSTKNNVLSLLSCSHILKYKLDWIHFGFATTALNRENLARALGARMAVSIRGFDIAVYPLKNPNCYRLLRERVDKLHYISDDLFTIALKQGLSSETAHRKITPAIDTSFYQGRVRGALGKSLKFVTVARLEWIKGFDYTLQALSILKSEGVDFEYHIIGEGADYERIVFAGYQLGIQNKLRLSGKRTAAEIKNALQESDIYLQYSIHEGFCNAVLEAQAMGLLCIVSDGGGLPENVIHEETGWVTPKRNPQALAAQVLKVLNMSPAERASISRSAIKRAETLFNLQKQRKDFEEFYQN